MVACELALISLIRKRFLDVPLRLSLLQVALGKLLRFPSVTSVLVFSPQI